MSRKLEHIGFYAVARNIILGSVFVLSACGRGELGTAEKLDLDATPVQTVEKMFVVQSENGILQMRMEADVMERYQNDSMSYERKGFWKQRLRQRTEGM